MAQVRAGLDVLVSRLSGLIKGRRVGLLCHQASVTRDLTHAVDAIRALPGVTLAALFAPEHGIAGTAQDLIHVASTRDRATGLTVWSLYGRRLAPTPEMLRGLDVLVVDLQDVGSRYYTFVWTMALAMQACARADLPWWCSTGRIRSAASRWTAMSPIPPTRRSSASIRWRCATA